MGKLKLTEEISEVLSEQIGSKPIRKEHSKPATYVAVHVVTGKAYIGSTEDLYRRISNHRANLRAGTHHNSNLQQAFNVDRNFEFHCKFADNKEKAVELEQTLLNTYLPTGELLNVASDAKLAGLGVRRSEETREKIRKSTVAQFSSDEAREKHSQISREQWQDPAYREKHLNQETSQETRSKISDSVKQLWANEEYRKTQTERMARNPIRIEATRRAISVPVEVDGKSFSSIAEASQALGINEATVRYRANSKRFPNYSRVKKEGK